MPARKRSIWSCRVSGRALKRPLQAKACSTLWLLLAQAVFGQAPLHFRAGEGVAIDTPAETVSAVRSAVRRSATSDNPAGRFVITPEGDGPGLLLSASVLTPPGRYSVTVSATQADGTELRAALSVILDPVKTVPSSAGKPAVVLLNGFQLANGSSCQPSNTTPHSKNTFGSLETQLLGDGIPVVYFFDNCVEGPNAKIEDLGNALGQFLALIKDDTGTPVAQVDLVGHSMGGLIARAYLSGLQSDGSLSPPANPRVRRLIMIATPNFGSFIAAEFAGLLGQQGQEMEPNSPFLWNLNRWNQFTDDLRGVDALALAGNAGNVGLPAKASDGVVSLTSASLGFVRDAAHTRILPYCHTDGLAIVGCTANGIANDGAPETQQIVRSYLSGTGAWSTIGTTPDKDQYLSQNGGVFFAEENAAGAKYLNDLSAVSWGSAALQPASGSVFYNELVKGGANSFTATSASAGKISCGPSTVQVGFGSTFRCKPSAAISGVGPLMTIVCITTPCPQPGKLVLPGSGGAITITGAGFGAQRCSACSVTVTPGGAALQISSWSDTSIATQLPPSFGPGLVQLTVHASDGGDSINFMLPALSAGIGPVVTSLTNAASGASGAVAPGEMVTIKGIGLGPSTGVQFSVDPGGRIATTLGGVQVFFGSFAAPITYASAGQVNAIVPYEVAGQTQLAMTVQYNGVSQPLTVNVTAAAPGVFTFNSSGAGQAVAANQDGSFNGPAGSGPFSPAPKGSFVVIYWTGGGQTVPPGSTGSVNSATTLKRFENVSVTVGGRPVTVAFAGAAPAFVDGVDQLNIQLPPDIPTGDALPVVITVGSLPSVATATLAVQ
jgi:uncharacterized protein (TIGR03437 family)